MEFSTMPASKAVRIYQTQTRIAELNKRVNIKSVQGQVDRVAISSKGRQLVQLKMISKAIVNPTFGPDSKLDQNVE